MGDEPTPEALRAQEDLIRRRNEQYERFYLASGARNRVLAHLNAPKERGARLVERFLQEKPE